jgi:hypothetical protein
MTFLEYLENIPTSKQLRLFKNEVKEKCEVCNSTSSKWMNGTCDPDKRSQKIIAQMTGKTVDELFPEPSFE